MTSGSVADVLVVGAGATGLACARELLTRGLDARVVDAAPRAGGVIDTLAVEGWRFEAGPTTIPGSAATFRAVCAELGIEGELLRSDPAAGTRWIFHRGRLRALPRGPGGLLASALLSPGAKARALTEPLRRWRAPQGAGDGEGEPTFEAFLTERFGRQVARRLGGAFVRGVYAAEVDELGAASAFPRLWALASEHGGVVRGLVKDRSRSAPDASAEPRGTLLSFERGLVRLVEAFADALGDHLRTGAQVAELQRAGERWRAVIAGGEDVEAQRVVLAVGAGAAAELLRPLAPDGLDLAPLAAVPHSDVVVVHLGLERADLPAGFGFLVPPDERDAPRALGVLFPSRVFPGRAPAGGGAASAFYRAGDVAGEDDAALERAAHGDLVRAIGAERAGEVDVARVVRWSGVLPRYGPGHGARVRALTGAVAGALPGLTLAGCYAGGVSVEDCLTRGRRIARELAEAAGPRSPDPAGERIGVEEIEA